jgi:hypothetical protein
MRRTGAQGKAVRVLSRAVPPTRIKPTIKTRGGRRGMGAHIASSPASPLTRGTVTHSSRPSGTPIRQHRWLVVDTRAGLFVRAPFVGQFTTPGQRGCTRTAGGRSRRPAKSDLEDAPLAETLEDLGGRGTSLPGSPCAPITRGSVRLCSRHHPSFSQSCYALDA